MRSHLQELATLDLVAGVVRQLQAFRGVLAVFGGLLHQSLQQKPRSVELRGSSNGLAREAVMPPNFTTA